MGGRVRSGARALLLAPALALLFAGPPARARNTFVLHEPIPPDPREDIALSLSLDGDLPAAIDTRSGTVPAPDPRRAIPPAGAKRDAVPDRSAAPDATFQPDRDTRRPDTLPYDEPFTPSTAPFKRLNAYDAVDAAYTLSVRDKGVHILPVAGTRPGDGEESFYGDMVVDLAALKPVRIPSVGPGARILRARAGVGSADVTVRFVKDGADNWFVMGEQSSRVRVVMEIAIPRAAFGGDFGSPSWAELGVLPVTLPPNALRAAEQVKTQIGVSRRDPPREAVAKLVAYFRGFADADEGPPPSRDIYLDLALSKKGVCRHRSFAFFVTAMSLGIPTRVITNEAHAWVEVFDGHAWRRIDLGGAGRTLRDAESTNTPYQPPADPFRWPSGSTRGSEMADRTRQEQREKAGDTANGSGGLASPSAVASAGPTSSGGVMSSGGPNASPEGRGDRPSPRGPQRDADDGQADDRPRAKLTVVLVDGQVRRGMPLHVKGEVTAEREPCAHVMVDIALRPGRGSEVSVGALATDDKGAYEGSIVLPSSMTLGAYEIVARTRGDTRCGAGVSP